MKVLWISHTSFPEALAKIVKTTGKHRGSGGWLFDSAKYLSERDDISLYIAFVSTEVSEIKEVTIGRIKYFIIPSKGGIDKPHHYFDKYWKEITNSVEPDIVHVHGIESCLALTYIRVCGGEKVVCSMQGLPNIISRYLLHGTSRWEMIKNITIRDILRGNNYLTLLNDNERKDKMIRETMKSAGAFIGRTSWDKAHLWAVNPQARYFFCNETMRSGFYNRKWSYGECEPHTIFISAMKGIHNFFKALPLIIREYPETKVNVATGGNLFQMDKKKKLMMTGYENYIKTMIVSNKLEKHVCFLGPLTEDQMIDSYLKCNVFVSPSQCENSSNSVCEAQLLGVPLAASYVGGMHDLIPDICCGRLYRCEEFEMLAKSVCDLFETSSSFDNSVVRSIALKRHDAKINAKRTIEIYTTIMEL